MIPTDESTLPDEHVDPDLDANAGSAGQVLRGRYVLEDLVATGASAGVWRGYDTELRRTVAVKLLHDEDGTRQRAASRFRREAVTAARLPHPGIVSVYDTGTDGALTWLALEHVDGPDVLTLLRHNPTGLPGTTAAAIVEQAARALATAHARGIVHRDVKPANLLVTSDGVVKVSDFGIAVATGEHIPVVTGDPVGTAAYAAPEQLVGDVDADPRMDVFSLGVVLFEALTGRAAFPSSGQGSDRQQPLRPRRVRADVDRSLDAVVARATDPDPAGRYADAGRLAAALRPLVPVEPIGLVASAVAPVLARSEPGQPGPAPRTTAPPGSRWRWVALVAGVLLSVGGAAALLLQAQGGDATDEAVEADAGVPVRDVRLYDPYGSVDDDPGRLVDVVDGDPTTGWTTPAYQVPLRSLRPGVGVRLDLGEPIAVESVTLDLAIPGVTVEVLSRDERPPAGSTEVDWELGARAVDAEEQEVLDVGGRSARHWLVWFTDLRETGGAWQASLTDVRFDPVEEQ